MNIAPDLYIPDERILLTFTHSGGPGGQHVNKVATAARLRVSLGSIYGLSPEGLATLRFLAGRRINSRDELLLSADQKRTQQGNKEYVLQRLCALICAAARPCKKRVPTKPSAAAKRRLRTAKTRHSLRKRERSQPVEL